MLSYRLGTVNDFHWGFKPVFRYSKRRNRHKEITIFCVFLFFCFLFSIFNYLKDFSKKSWITALARSMKNIRGLNQLSAAANPTTYRYKVYCKILKISAHAYNKISGWNMRLFLYALIFSGTYASVFDMRL